MSEALVVGLLIILKLLGIFEELAEGLWQVLAEYLLNCLHLDLKNVRILLKLIDATNALPREVASQKLDDHVGNRFEIVSP
jgi:hypothetical protein